MAIKYSSPVPQNRTVKMPRILFTEFIDQVYLPAAKTRKLSWRVDERIINKHLLPFFAKFYIADINRNDIEEWLNQLKDKGLAHSTCNRFLAVMKSICYLAEARGYCLFPPVRGVKCLRVYNYRETHLTMEETARLLTELESMTEPEALILQLIILTGARKSEILKAKWENVNLAEKTLIVPVSKSGKIAYIPLSNSALEIIAKLPTKETSPWLFPSKRNSQKPIATFIISGTSFGSN